MSALKSKNINTQNSDASNLPFIMSEIKKENYNSNVTFLNISELTPAPQSWNFFTSLPDDKLLELVCSIKDNGLIHPIVVWIKDNNDKIILSGHNRVKAYKLLLEKTKDKKYLSIPCVIKKDLNENTAREIIVDSNWVGRTLNTSEKIKSIYFKYIMMGRKKKSAPVNGTYERTYDIIAKDFNISGKQVQRYIKLNNLIEPLLKMLDKNDLSLRSGIKLSDFDENCQKAIFNEIKNSCDNKKIALLKKNMDILEIKKTLSNLYTDELVSVSFSIPKSLKNDFINLCNDWIENCFNK